MSMNELDADNYGELLVAVKQRIRAAQYEALKAVNKELIALYWDIGRLIVSRQQGKTWGKSVVEQLARDLQDEFPGISGFSARNIWRMRDFYLTYHADEKLSPLVAEIGWTHNLVIMEKCKDDLEREFYIRIAEKMLKFPLLGEKIDGKWNLRLTREFDMTNDSHLFKQQSGKGRLPLYEGKMIHQFTHQFAEPRYWVDEKEGRKALLGKNGSDKGQKLDYQSYRLGFRAIARNTDARTLLVGAIPNNVFCGNSILVSSDQTQISSAEIVVAQALFNSFVLDFYARQMVSANINMFYIYQLPIPRLTKGDRYFTDIVQRAAKLICTTPEFDELAQETLNLTSRQCGVTIEGDRAKLRAELDGIIAHLYGLTEEEFAYILSTFPIVSDTVKESALEAYRTLLY